MKNVCLSLAVICFLSIVGLVVSVNSYQDQRFPTTLSLGFQSLPQTAVTTL